MYLLWKGGKTLTERVITLFGEPEAMVDGGPVDLGPAWPLLAVLLLWRQPRPIRMGDVVAMLKRPESLADDPGSRFRKHKRLVQTLLRLELPKGQALTDVAGAILAHTRVDVVLFDEKIGSADSGQVREAVSLRRPGPLLADWRVSDAVGKERIARERKYQDALWRLIQEEHHARPEEALRFIKLLSDTEGLPPARVEVLQETKLTLEHKLLRRNQSGGDGSAAKPTAPFRPVKVPHYFTELIGREREKEVILGLLAAPGLVTLTGTAGIGKTRLAVAVARSLQEAAVYEIGFADLTTADAAQLSQQVGSSLGLKEEKGCTWRESLLAFLEDRSILLVWDNCEHLVPSCADLATEILAKCPSARILATSREPLRAYGEKRHPVPVLSLPAHEGPAPPESASPSEALRLFTARARDVRADFRLTPRNGPAILRICRDLDGLPLAIEFAAALVDTQTCEQIAADLHRRFEVLVDGPASGAARHSSLQAAFDASYDLLDPAEKGLFHHIGVFAGGFCAEAAEAVSAESPRPGPSVPLLLPRLVRKSLVVAEEHAGGMRFRLLETVRQYAGHRLMKSGADAAARRRHAEWFLSLAEEAEPNLTGADQKRWLDRLETEHDNLRAAMTWYGQCAEGGGQCAEGGEAYLRLTCALSNFWRTRGYLGEGRRWLTEALRCGADAPASARARALNNLGSLALFQGDFEEARHWHEESLGLCRAAGDMQGVGKALHNLGTVAFYQGDYGVARERYEESLVLCREMRDDVGAAHALNNLGSTALYQSDLAAAWVWFEESLGLYRAAGDMQGVHKVSHNLGNVAFYQGHYGIARERYQESLELLKDIGDGRDRAYALNNLASAALPQGDFKAVRAALEESLTLFLEVGDKQGRCSVLAGFASLAAAQNQGARAGRLWGAAEALRETVGVPLHESDRVRYEQEVAGVREALGEAALAGAWAAGRAMTWGQVVTLALNVDGI